MHRRPALRMVGGRHNVVVEWHTDTCQHCGAYATPADRRCTQCQVQTHSQCIPTNEDGRCDMCTHQLDEATALCALCERVDPPLVRPDSTDRLVKQVVCFGRTWTHPGVMNLLEDEAHLQQEGYLFLEEYIDETKTYDPRVFPGEGGHKMCARSSCGPDGRLVVSEPTVVHTWCAICLFQVSPSLRGEWKDTLLDNLRHPRQIPFGTAKNLDRSATWRTHACVFCNSREGWTTFCLYHLTMKAGCVGCRDGPALPCRMKSSHAFHPSCAVWAGMQRIIRSEGCGMLCSRNKDFRAARMRHLKPWLDFPSGINEMLPGALDVEPHRLVPEKGVGFKGARFCVGTHAAPLSAAEEPVEKEEQEKAEQRPDNDTHRNDVHCSLRSGADTHAASPPHDGSLW